MISYCADRPSYTAAEAAAHIRARTASLACGVHYAVVSTCCTCGLYHLRVESRALTFAADEAAEGRVSARR